MILLFTDFGAADLYVGQMKAAILAVAPGLPVIDLLHEVPAFDVSAGAHLLAALAPHLPQDAAVVAVVDPGVGGERRPVAVRAAGRWFVGPDNGLLSVVAGRAADARVFEIAWRPRALSESFHGRDLFGPAAARIALGETHGVIVPVARLDEALDPGDFARLIHIDRYGNAITGLRAGSVDRSALLRCGALDARYARVFCEATPGIPFWYENSIGLLEIAIARGSAAASGRLRAGDPVTVG